MTATVIRDGTVGEQPPAPIWVRMGRRTNITRFTYASSSHAPIAKLIRKRTIIGALNVAFHPIEHKLGYTSRVIHRDSALVNVCHAEKTLVGWPGKYRGASRLRPGECESCEA